MITSLQNSRVKEAVKLRRRAGRDHQNRFVIDGLREIHQALVGGISVVEAFACHALQNDYARQVQSEFPSGLEVSEVSPAVWEKLSYGNRRDGLMVVARWEPQELDSLPVNFDLPIIVLDRIEKPGNVGAIFRTAAAAGVSAIIVADPGTDVCNPNAIRASLGSIFRVPWATANVEDTMKWLGERHVPVFVSHLAATKTHWDADLSEGCAVVLGSEADGVSAAWETDLFTRFKIPMQSELVDSLNVASCAAIVLYEAQRQRRQLPPA